MVIRFCLAMLCASVAHAGESVFVELRSEAVVEQASVLLRDIARVVSRDPAVAERFGSLPVGRCASLAGDCRLDADLIVPEVEARAAEAGVRLVWGANRSVAVSGKPRQVSLAAAIERGAAWAVQTYGQGAPVFVDVVETQTILSVPHGVVSVTPEIGRVRRAGAVLEMPVRVAVDGVEVAQPVVRYVVRRSVDGSGDAGAGSSAASIANDARMAVAKDQRVRLLIDAGPVRVETEGVAMGDARVGGTVKVRRSNGLAALTGRAVDLGTVQVTEN